MTTATAAVTSARATAGAIALPLDVPDPHPRYLSLPEGELDWSLGDEAVELAASAGLTLDPWEAFVLRCALTRLAGKWAGFEIGLDVARQNGKGAILEARELTGLFILAERLLIHSAHQFDTSLEAFRRLLWLIEDTPDLDQQVKRVSRAHGEEGIELKSGQRIRFRTRTKGGGRGFSSDCLILDEAMILPATAHGALLPTLSARPNPQVWYAGSAVDQQVNQDGVVFASIRKRGIAGEDPGLVYIEYSADAEMDEVERVADDPDAWRQANPGLGIRISESHIANERRSMDLRTFATERLGVGDWPDPDELDALQIDLSLWASLADAAPITGMQHFAFDTRPDRSVTSIAAAGYGDDGLPHVRIVERKPGTGWVVERLIGLVGDAGADGVACDSASPAASLVPQLENAGIGVHSIGSGDLARACGLFYDLVDEEALHHQGTQELAAALKGAARRPLADAWAWSRKTSAADISPLVAATLALWRAVNAKPIEPLVGFAG